MAAVTHQGRARSAFPSEAESLALKASLLDGDRALEAWRALSTPCGPEAAGIAWITPMLMTSVARLCPSDPWVAANPDFLKLASVRGRAVTRAGEKTLHQLEEAGIRTLALKGLALGATVYPAPALRTVSDLDILVPRNDVFRAIECLKAGGLRSGFAEPKQVADLRKGHAHPFHAERRDGLGVDLHWHVLASARGDGDDASFWSGAQPARVGSASTLVLCAEDQLLHVLVHGVRWTAVPHVRWVADAALILRAASGSLSIPRFLESVVRFDVVTPVQEGLRFVDDLLGEGSALLKEVRQLKRSRFSQHAFKARATAYEERSLTDRVALRIENALWSTRARRNPGPSAR